MAGLDTHYFMTTTDPIDIGVMQRIAKRVHALQADRDDQQAIRISNYVGKMLGVIK